jgi:magnesium transporter
MDALVLDDVLARLRVALEHNDLGSASAIIKSLRPADQADVFSELDDEVQVGLLPRLNPADSADILEKLHDQDAAELAGALSTDAVIRIVDQMEPDEAADLLGDLHPARAQVVLAGLEDSEEVSPLLLHPDDSAGGLMTSDFLALRRRMTAGEAIQAVRDWQPESEAVY